MNEMRKIAHEKYYHGPCLFFKIQTKSTVLSTLTEFLAARVGCPLESLPQICRHHHRVDGQSSPTLS